SGLSVCVHGDKPHHHYRFACAPRLPNRRHLRILEARIALPTPIRTERNPDLDPSAGRADRGDFVLVTTVVSQLAAVRQHARRSHCPQGVRRLRDNAGRTRPGGLLGCRVTIDHGSRAHRAPAARGLPASLCLRHPDLHLSQRCHPSWPLNGHQNTTKEHKPWIPLLQNTLAQASPASAWAVPASASAPSSATILRQRCAILQPRKASSATCFS